MTERTRVTFDLPRGVTLAHVLGSTPSDRAEAYARALVAAARDLGLPRPPAEAGDLKAWLDTAQRASAERACKAEATSWSEVVTSIIADHPEALTLIEAEDRVEKALIEAREAGRVSGLREAVAAYKNQWEEFELVAPTLSGLGTSTLSVEGKWVMQGSAHQMLFKTREEAEAAKLTCAPWWEVNP